MVDFTPPKADHQFWSCPCFTDDPKYILKAEEVLGRFLYSKAKDVMLAEHVCLNRRLSTFIKMLALCAAEIPAAARPAFDAQAHDYLTAFLDQHPSK